MEVIYFGMILEETRQILLLEFGDVPCKARLHTIDNWLVNRINDHTHIEDRRKVQGAQVIEQINEEGSNSRENPETIISNSTLGLGDKVRATLSKYETNGAKSQRTRFSCPR